MENQEVKDNDLKIIETHVNALMEHFDTVQIFCTRHEGKEVTTSCRSGAGDWYSRYGHIRLWLEDQTLSGCTCTGDEGDEE